MALASQMFDPTSASPQVIVLGMHRSGTSALAGVLTQLGGFAGHEREIMAATRDNPKGYFERHDVVAINDHLLASAGARWNHPMPFDPLQVAPKARKRFERDALKVISALPPNRISVIKDPRLCLTLPVWQPLLSKPHIVLIWRNPVAVVRSLLERGSSSFTRGLALWEHYVLASLRATRGIPTQLVHYEDLITDTATVVAELATFCGLHQAPSRDAISWIDSKLRRQAPEGEGRHAQLNADQRRLCQDLAERTVLAADYRPPELSAASRAALAHPIPWTTRITESLSRYCRHHLRPRTD